MQVSVSQTDHFRQPLGHLSSYASAPYAAPRQNPLGKPLGTPLNPLGNPLTSPGNPLGNSQGPSYLPGAAPGPMPFGGSSPHSDPTPSSGLGYAGRGSLAASLQGLDLGLDLGDALQSGRPPGQVCAELAEITQLCAKLRVADMCTWVYDALQACGLFSPACRAAVCVKCSLCSWGTCTAWSPQPPAALPAVNGLLGPG